MSHITVDNNEAYVKTQNTNKLYCEVGENAHTVHMDDNQYFYNNRNSNTYTKSYVSLNDVVMLKRSYCFTKCLSLLRTIVSFTSPADGSNIPYVAVFLSLCVYHLEQGDKQKIYNLVHQKRAKQAIIADIYGCRYGGVEEYGLADSTDPGDFHAKLESLQEEWDRLCLVSTNGFARNESPFL